MKQISLRLSDELADKVASAKGDVPLNTWITRAIETALAATSSGRTEAQALRLPPPPSTGARLPPPQGFGQGGLGKGYVPPRPKAKK